MRFPVDHLADVTYDSRLCGFCTQTKDFLRRRLDEVSVALREDQLIESLQCMGFLPISDEDEEDDE